MLIPACVAWRCKHSSRSAYPLSYTWIHVLRLWLSPFWSKYGKKEDWTLVITHTHTHYTDSLPSFRELAENPGKSLMKSYISVFSWSISELTVNLWPVFKVVIQDYPTSSTDLNEADGNVPCFDYNILFVYIFCHLCELFL